MRPILPVRAGTADCGDQIAVPGEGLRQDAVIEFAAADAVTEQECRTGLRERTWLAKKRSLGRRGSANRPLAVAGSAFIQGACLIGKADISVETVNSLQRAHPEVEGDSGPAGCCSSQLNCCDLDAA